MEATQNPPRAAARDKTKITCAKVSIFIAGFFNQTSHSMMLRHCTRKAPSIVFFLLPYHYPCVVPPSTASPYHNNRTLLSPQTFSYVVFFSFWSSLKLGSTMRTQFPATQSGEEAVPPLLATHEVRRVCLPTAPSGSLFFHCHIKAPPLASCVFFRKLLNLSKFSVLFSLSAKWG